MLSNAKPKPQIICCGETLNVAVCPKCQAKFYPRSILAAHLHLHKVRELYYKGLQRQFLIMREM
jgi:hypothetical protein